MRPAAPRRQSFGEELANALSHGLGLVGAIAAIPILAIAYAHRGDESVLIGAVVFAVSATLLYAASTVYHALPPGRAKRVFRVLDHSAIFLLIAGTYTPFTLGVLNGAWGWTLFAVVWTLAGLGITFKVVAGVRWSFLSTACYLGMGWLAVVAAKPIVTVMPAAGLAWLVAGGLAYTAGVAFYAADRMRYAHFVWHLFVLAGTTCHFFAVLSYAA